MAPRPYRSEFSDTDAAIVEVRKEKVFEKRTSNFDAWVTYGELQSESVRECEWALGDGSRVELPVVEGRHASGDYLQISGDRLYPEQRNVVVRAAQEVLGSRPVGMREVERMMPVGTELTAVGELSMAVEHPSEFRAAVRRGGRMLVLKQPRGNGPFLLSRQPLPDVIASLQASSAMCQQFATAFTLLGASMLAAAATHKAVLWLRERRARQRFEKTLRERRAAAHAAGGGGGAAAAAAAAEGMGGAAAAGKADEEARGALVNDADEEGWTPLHSAASAGHESVAALLVSLGAAASATTAQQRTPLHYAASKGQAGIVALLLGAGAPADARDATGTTALHRAAATGRLGICRALLAAGAKLDPRNRQKQTPLLLAALGGHQAAALLLAGRGADVEAEDDEGQTPLGAAAAHGQLREGLAALAKGEKSLDDFMIEDV
ncbi:26S proteasome non-ATPase regulatory subunit 10 [Micractinium conductrix]|uniref:RING-type E3 ubiquitin transferase n=1 Tax=Micractinium conductrix TaxID=554055 RepID=A0A2P6VBF7_9CHLO|nr:26S proteasome non-ATPase regulatory subunit 10 [Micractinium conductrix]|eukprot:PSC71423.1 26S proteasome non-ATPase regulatory subunit 10 [Micractinium conductrix]